MPEKKTYYAIVNEFSSRERPGGVLRRVEDDEGQNDEAFTRNLRVGAFIALVLLRARQPGQQTVRDQRG